MISIDALRKIDPLNTAHLTEKELEGVRNSFYEFGQLMFEDWHEQKFGSKYPLGSLTSSDEQNTM